jgi:hypothetical protein
MSTALKSLYFTQAKSMPGLVPVNNPSLANGIEEQYIIRQAAAIGGIDYVFFRRFSDDRSSRAAAFIIDNSDDHLDKHQLAEIHRKLWWNGCTPLLYVGWQTRVDVLSCARGPDFWKNSNLEYEPADWIDVSSQIANALQHEKISRYSAHRLSDGTFWDDPANSPLAESGQAAHQQLIRAVIEADKELNGHKQPLLRRLLLLTVLIKYLEDRGVFPAKWFSQFHNGAESFFDLLRHGTPDSIRELLRKLERKFNGDVFELPEDQQQLTKRELNRFAALVEARTIKSQRYLWEQYSFRYIPVEILSHLYQHFAQKGKGAVFTPPIVASLMLDYAMPYKHLAGNERILDPTCGSGIFLVSAFRRLVHFWQSQNEWRQLDVATLKNILKKSIFGIELQEEAVHLAAFSLALAICDALQPNVIWKDLRFDKLVGNNLLIGDFAEQISNLKEIAGNGSFDIIVGNPPFMSKLTDAARQYSARQKRNVAVPDNNLAYFVAEEAMFLLKDEGKLCLIQPQGFLNNENAKTFRKEFFSTHQLDAILDFTSIRKLFDGADAKAVALLATNRKPDSNHLIQHLTFRRTTSIKERISFDLDHYDRHLVTQEAAEQYPWVWRVNLLGGGRLQNLAERLSRMPTLKEYVEAENWDYGEGFIAATAGKRESVPWLTGQPFLPTEALTENGIDESRIGTVTATRFRSAYTKARYSGPIVMIKEHESLPCSFRSKGFLAYKAKIIGIHSDEVDTLKLERFYNAFVSNRSILRSFCMLVGTQALTGKASAILKRDIDALPWPQNGHAWDLSKYEKLLCEDLIRHFGDFVRLGQNSCLLKEQVAPTQLKKYADIFVEMLGSVYKNLREVKCGLLDGLAYQAFCFGDKSELDWPSDWSKPLREVVFFQNSDVLRTVRVLRFYSRNTIVIVKPDRLRYWIPSTAVRDADETLFDLQQQGY